MSFEYLRQNRLKSNDTVLDQYACETITGKLRALIGIKDFGYAEVLDSFLKTVHTKSCIHCVRQPPCQYLATVPVNDRNQVHKAVQQPNIGNIGTPHLIGSDDIQAPYPPAPTFASSVAPACD